MRTVHRGKRSTVAAGTLVTDIDHLQIAAPKGCEAEARQFFGEILGLAEIEKPESLRSRGGCWFRVGSRQLHIGVEEPFRPTTKAHPAFSVTDIQAAFANLQTIATFGRDPCSGRPCQRISPREGGRSPESIRSIVDLPEPEGPRRARIVFGSIEKSMGATT